MVQLVAGRGRHRSFLAPRCGSAFRADLTNCVPHDTVTPVKLIRIRIDDVLRSLGLSVRRLGTRSEGRRVQEAILAQVAAGREAVVVLDLNGLEMMNSSFADEVIATPLQRILNGEHGGRYFVLDSPSRELVEDAQRPLENRDLSVLCFGGFPDGPWWILGVDRPVFRPLLELLMKHGSLDTGMIAKLLDDTKSVQNFSNRLAELAKRGLIKRAKEFGTKGGQTHTNMSLLEAAK